jgi:hypothetical protein
MSLLADSLGDNMVGKEMLGTEASEAIESEQRSSVERDVRNESQ